MSQGTRVASCATVRKRNHATMALNRHDSSVFWPCIVRCTSVNFYMRARRVEGWWFCKRNFSVTPPCFGFKFQGFSRSFLCELLLEGVCDIVLELWYVVLQIYLQGWGEKFHRVRNGSIADCNSCRNWIEMGVLIPLHEWKRTLGHNDWLQKLKGEDRDQW